MSFTAGVPSGALIPLATSTTDLVFQKTTGSIVDLRRSPFQGGPAFDDGFVYTSVSAGSTATCDFGVDARSVSFIWGSPDTYNSMSFHNNGELVETHAHDGPLGHGVNLAAPFATVTASGLLDTVVLMFGRDGFEFADMSIAAVPVPAASLLLVSALGGVAAFRRRTPAA